MEHDTHNIPSPDEEIRAGHEFQGSKKDIIQNIAALIAIFVFLFLLFQFFDIKELRLYIEAAGIWAPLMLILTKASTIVFAPLSGSFLYPLAGALFGFPNGFFYLVLGDALGGVISFYLSRYFGRSIVERMLGSNSGLIAKTLTMAGTVRGFLMARIFLAALPEAASYIAGLTRIRFLPFFIIFVGVGLIPTALLSFFGSILTVNYSPLLFGLILGAGSVAAGVGLYLFYFWSKRY